LPHCISTVCFVRTGFKRLPKKIVITYNNSSSTYNSRLTEITQRPEQKKML
jgi:hypothetical protein